MAGPRHVYQQTGALDVPPEPRECWRAALLREGHYIYNIDYLELGLEQEVKEGNAMKEQKKPIYPLRTPSPMTQLVFEMRKESPKSFCSLLVSSFGMQRRDFELSAESNMDLHLNAQRQRPKNVRNFQSASFQQHVPHPLAQLPRSCERVWRLSCLGRAWPGLLPTR